METLRVAVYCRYGNFGHACALAVQHPKHEVIETYDDAENDIQAFVLADLWHKKKIDRVIALSPNMGPATIFDHSTAGGRAAFRIWATMLQYNEAVRNDDSL